MKLAYLAYDRSGRQVADTIEADGPALASQTLRGRGLYVTRITGLDERPPTGRFGLFRRPGQSGRLRNLSLFMRQLYVLLASGTPLVQALGALERQARAGPWRNALADVRAQVEEGTSLTQALSAHPEYFDSVCRSLVAAGEAAGNLPVMLDRLASMARKQLHIRSAIVGAMIYPMLLLAVATAVMTLMLLFVIPRFGDLFKTLGVSLPPTTQALISAGAALRSYWWGGLLALAAAGAGLKVWLGSAAGGRMLDTLLLRLPQVGRIARSLIIARISRLLGVLLHGHVPVLEALELTIHSVGNHQYAALLARARDDVTRGDPMSTAFSDARLVSPSVYEAIRSGEQSGQVGPLLLNIADFLDEENEVVVRSLTSILEPLMLVAMGLVVGALALSLFTPLFDMTAMTQGGAQ